MRLLTAHFAALSVRLLVTALFRKFAKESIMKSHRLLVRKRAKLLVKESINNIHIRGGVIRPLKFLQNPVIIMVVAMKKILVLNGPNLNMTGIRKKNVYGGETLKQINEELKIYGKANGAKVSFFQSNHEGDLIDVIHESKDEFDGVVINAGAYTHYSYAIRDAIEAVSEFTPFVEVHMSNIHEREDFRKISVITDVCIKQICGYGKDSYKMGIDLLMEIL